MGTAPCGAVFSSEMRGWKTFSRPMAATRAGCGELCVLLLLSVSGCMFDASMGKHMHMKWCSNGNRDRKHERIATDAFRRGRMREWVG